MNDIVIHAEKLSKLYRIDEKIHTRTLREAILSGLAAPVRFFKKSRLADHENRRDVWALKGASFDIKRGEVVGIIGRNGVGKSTLLKILSRITEPTEGFVEVAGRVGSLLEVGVGFHSELTGRENTYLNGAILGMKKKEIDKKFDEIIAFSEIDKFVDTPVKYYSSGMFVRLAFAVAASLEPEILLVDEVLAVGDIAFQKKCLGKMGDVAKSGRTVLFVTHQMNSIRRLCERCLWLDNGTIRMADSTAKVVSAYESHMLSQASPEARKIDVSKGKTQFLSWEILEPKSEQLNIFTGQSPVKLKFTVKVNEPVTNGHHSISLNSLDNQIMWGWAKVGLNLPVGIHEFVYTLADLPLRPGPYTWRLSLFSEGRLLDVWFAVPELIIATTPLTHFRDEWSGILNLPCDFKVNSQ